MDFDDLDEVAPVAENAQPPTGTVLDWLPRTEKIPGLVNSMHRFSEKVLRELDPSTRSAITERSKVIRGITAKLRLLCIHGVADSYEQSWFELEAESPPEIEVVVYELPGHGRRDSEIVCTSVQDLADDAFGALRGAMETGAFAFLGHSVGCLVVLELAKRALEELNVKPVVVFMVERGAPQFSPLTPKGVDALQDVAFSLEVDSKSVLGGWLELKSWDLDGCGGKEVVLMISSISDELQQSWAASNMGKLVKPKDEIVLVNGLAGNADALRAELEKAAKCSEKVKLEVLRRPHDFLLLHVPIISAMCKLGPNRTFLRWQRSWCCENDTQEVGYFMFTCPLVVMSAKAGIEAVVDLEDLDPMSKAIVEYGAKRYNMEIGDGKAFMGQFPLEAFQEWRSWTENTDAFSYVECPACDHMTMKHSEYSNALSSMPSCSRLNCGSQVG